MAMRIRPDKDTYYLDIAAVVSERSTCVRRHYGAVIVNNDEIVSTGYNGNVRGAVNCYERMQCTRVEAEHNDGLYIGCESVHAEMNALISASRAEMIGATLYLAGFDVYSLAGVKHEEILDATPCPICSRMIKNAGIKRVVTRSKSYDLSKASKE